MNFHKITCEFNENEKCNNFWRDWWIEFIMFMEFRMKERLIFTILFQFVPFLSISCTSLKSVWWIFEPSICICVWVISSFLLIPKDLLLQVRYVVQKLLKCSSPLLLDLTRSLCSLGLYKYTCRNISQPTILLPLYMLFLVRITGFWFFSIVRYSRKNKKHDVSETGSVSILKWPGEDTYSDGFLRKS
jgi:hypothetical protein